jgi:type II secretory pathway predicted ATPase ExeA
MYQNYFGLHSDPFALGPSLRFLYRSRAHAETMAHLGYGLEQGEDIILIVGAIGTGKTLALHSLQAKVSRLFHQVLVNVTAVSYPEFLKLVLHEMGQAWPAGADTADLLCLLKDRAQATGAAGQKILLIVDEAQNLDLRTLEAIRLLTNIGQPERQLFQIVLAGQPALEAQIERPELAQLRQRIRIHYRLEPLTADETVEYITHRLSVAGRRDPVFTRAALARIHELSRGIPRLVNHLAGHALLSAYVAKEQRVDARHVASEGLPAAPTPVIDATPPATVAETGSTPVAPASAGAAEATPTTPVAAAPVAPAPAQPPLPPAPPPLPPAPARRLTTRPQRARPEAARWRVPGWAWVWIIVLALLAAGALSLLRDEGRQVTAPLQVGRLLPAPAEPAPAEPAPAEPLPAEPLPAEPLPAEPLPAEAERSAPAEPIAPVERAAPGSTAPPADRAGVAAQAGIWLHVASFRDTTRAARYQALLRGTGNPVEHRDVALADGRQWRRILIGPFMDPEQADAAAADLEAAGLITFHQRLPD